MAPSPEATNDTNCDDQALAPTEAQAGLGRYRTASAAGLLLQDSSVVSKRRRGTPSNAGNETAGPESSDAESESTIAPRLARSRASRTSSASSATSVSTVSDRPQRSSRTGRSQDTTTNRAESGDFPTSTSSDQRLSARQAAQPTSPKHWWRKDRLMPVSSTVATASTAQDGKRQVALGDNGSNAVETLLENTSRIWKNSVSIEAGRALDVLGRVVWANCFARCVEEKVRDGGITESKANGEVLLQVADRLNALQGHKNRKCIDYKGSAKAMKFDAFRFRDIVQHWGTAALAICALTDRFISSCHQTNAADLAVLHKVMEKRRAAISMAADCLQPGWRNILAWVQDETIAASTTRAVTQKNFHRWVMEPDGTLTALPVDFTSISRCYVDLEAWPEGSTDPRRVMASDVYLCETCELAQVDAGDTRSEARCVCLENVQGSNCPPAAVEIFRTRTMGLGVRALKTYHAEEIIGEFVGVITNKRIEGKTCYRAQPRTGLTAYANGS